MKTKFVQEVRFKQVKTAKGITVTKYVDGLIGLNYTDLLSESDKQAGIGSGGVWFNRTDNDSIVVHKKDTAKTYLVVINGKNTKGKKVLYRDAKSGRFVSKEVAIKAGLISRPTMSPKPIAYKVYEQSTIVEIEVIRSYGVMLNDGKIAKRVKMTKPMGLAM